MFRTIRSKDFTYLMDFIENASTNKTDLRYRVQSKHSFVPRIPGTPLCRNCRSIVLWNRCDALENRIFAVTQRILSTSQFPLEWHFPNVETIRGNGSTFFSFIPRFLNHSIDRRRRNKGGEESHFRAEFLPDWIKPNSSLEWNVEFAVERQRCFLEFDANWIVDTWIWMDFILENRRKATMWIRLKFGSILFFFFFNSRWDFRFVEHTIRKLKS